jgi:hypothetical protein
LSIIVFFSISFSFLDMFLFFKKISIKYVLLAFFILIVFFSINFDASQKKVFVFH